MASLVTNRSKCYEPRKTYHGSSSETEPTPKCRKIKSLCQFTAPTQSSLARAHNLPFGIPRNPDPDAPCETRGV